MGLTEIVDFVKSNVDFLPIWFTSVFWHLVSALLLIYLLTAVFNAIGSQSFINPVRAIFQLLWRVVRSALTGYMSGMQSPIIRPKSRLVGLALGLIHTYLMAVLFFVVTVIILMLLVLSDNNLPVINQFGVLGLLVFFFSLSWYFRSQTDREWLALKEQWRVVRQNRDASA